MAERGSVQDAVIGGVLEDIGRGARGIHGVGPRIAARTGSRRGAGGIASDLAMNALRVPQSVVKRVGQGGCHVPGDLRRQANYILRDEAQVAAWSNQIGVDRPLGEDGVEQVVDEWSSAWAGTPQRGHTDHIILSFPKSTDPAKAEVIAREWGETLFASGNYRDRYRYVAALHANTEHVHAHFIVDKVGVEEGKFLSISRYSEVSYETMRELHAEIAGRHDLALNATSRLSRGIVGHAPRQADVQAARKAGRAPYEARMDPAVRAARQEELRAYAEGYRALAEIAAVAGGEDDWMARLAGAARDAAATMGQGRAIMAGFEEVGPHVDPAERLAAARDGFEQQAARTWEAVRNMESCAEKAELESGLAARVGTVARVLGSDILPEHQPLPAGQDPYVQPTMAALRGLVAGQGAHVAAADEALGTFQARMETALVPSADMIATAGTGVEEVAARFTFPVRSRAALEASRPEGAEQQGAWAALETSMAAQAREVAADLPLAPALREAVARGELEAAPRTARLADVDGMRGLVAVIDAGLSDEDRRAVTMGRMEPLAGRVSDPGLRHAVRSEITAICAAPPNAAAEDRDSETVAKALERMEAFDRTARARDARARDAAGHETDHGLEL